MGRVCTKTAKKAARATMETCYTRLGNGCHTYKRVSEEIAMTPSKDSAARARAMSHV